MTQDVEHFSGYLWVNCMSSFKVRCVHSIHYLLNYLNEFVNFVQILDISLLLDEQLTNMFFLFYRLSLHSVDGLLGFIKTS